MGYFTQVDLEAALSKGVVTAAYDDDHSQTPSATGLAACIAYGTAMCDSFLRNILSGPSGTVVQLPLSSPPDEVKFAALDFGIAYTMRRRPDVVRAMSEKPWTDFYEMAVEQMKRYAQTIQRITPTAASQALVGGSAYGNDPDDDSDPTPRWGKMGDFS
jgi:hypothetical protein